MELSFAQIEALMQSAPAHRPYAEVDESMDCVRVRFRDCSVTEHRVSKMITILLDNHPEEGQAELAGLSIKGLHSIGFSIPASHRVADFINALVAIIPPEEAEELRSYHVIDNPVIMNTELMIETHHRLAA